MNDGDAARLRAALEPMKQEGMPWPEAWRRAMLVAGVRKSWAPSVLDDGLTAPSDPSPAQLAYAEGLKDTAASREFWEQFSEPPLRFTYRHFRSAYLNEPSTIGRLREMAA